MIHQSLPLADTLGAPSVFFDYINQKPTLKPFYGYFATLDNFEKQIELKSSFEVHNRKVLVETLTKQYTNINSKPDFSVLENSQTFTVTTGHQLNIFTGPLYVIYKIVTVINLAKQLKQKYPQYNFVPVYWMASEDHDFQEISSFNLFGKKYNWQTQQTGAVGRMNPRDLGEALKILPEKLPIFEKAYLKNTTLADAVRSYMHDLFGEHGLMCVDGDDAALKNLFAFVLKDELLNQPSFLMVKNTTTQLEKLGYEAIISPREINLFYVEKNLRERIVADSGGYKVLHTDLCFTEDEILKTLQDNPEKFSPNVCLRPVYQEVILPNIAYIGGPSEVPYWLQLGSVFEHFKVPLPVIMPRNFGLIVSAANQKRAEKLGLTVEELFESETKLRKTFVEKNTKSELSLATEKHNFEELFATILTKAIDIDKTLEATVAGEKTKLLASLEALEKRMKKAEERNQEAEVNQLVGLKNKLFPNGSAQERVDNFLNFYLNDKTFIDKLLAAFDPLDFRFNVLTETV
jgi:bacillithiol synthase